MANADDSAAHFRDGTSRQQRTPRALDPSYVSVDERSVLDFLKFTREYSQKLPYFNAHNQVEGDWSPFLPEDLKGLAAWLEDPERFAADEQSRARFARPHLTLFLNFLKLLDHSRQQLNQFTERHLDFYYRRVLQLATRAGCPDHVHVLVDLVPDQAAIELPVGTALLAGQDALGNDLLYRTDQELVVGRAQVADLKSLHVERRIVRLSDVRQTPELLREATGVSARCWDHAVGSDRSFLAVLELALGDPASGYLLPPYPVVSAPQEGQRAAPVDAYCCQDLDRIIREVRETLCLPLITFRELVRALQALNPHEGPAKADWQTVNDLLQSRPDSGFTLTGFEPDTFKTNLLAALGKDDAAYRAMFQGIPEVDDVYDLYRQYKPLIAQKLKTHIENQPPDTVDSTALDVITLIEGPEGFGMELGDFQTMMETVESLHEKWRHVFAILRTAGRQKRGEKAIGQVDLRADTTFFDKLQMLLDAVSLVESTAEQTLLDWADFERELVTLESYFCLSADEFAFVRAVFAKYPTALPWEYSQAEELLEQAGRKRAREREGIAFDELAPKPEIELFDNLYAATNATLVRANQGLQQAHPRWRTFGGGSTDAGVQPATIGIAIASPLLALSEGHRTIHLTFTFDAKHAGDGVVGQALDEVHGPFRFLLSMPKGMLEVGDSPNQVTWQGTGFKANEKRNGSPTLEIKIHLQPQDPPVVALANPSGSDAVFPELQILLKDMLPSEDASDEAAAASQRTTNESAKKKSSAFAHLELKDVTLKVTVGTAAETTTQKPLVGRAGLTQIVLRNDEAILDSKKPFEPFGANPTVGSRLWLGHPELMSKPLTSLAFDIEWMGIPEEGLVAHYANYSLWPTKGPDLGNFKVAVSLVDHGVEKPLGARNLFKNAVESGSMGDSTRAEADKANFLTTDSRSDASTAKRPLDSKGVAAAPLRTLSRSSLKILPGTAGKSTSNEGDSKRALDDLSPEDLSPDDLSLEDTSFEDVSQWNRHFQWVLESPDFQHSRYPVLATSKSMELALAFAKEQKPADASAYQINPPYTPKIKKLQAHYEASATLVLADDGGASNSIRLQHLEPFGRRPLRSADSAEEQVTEAPSVGGNKVFHLLPRFNHEGELFIGLRDLAPPQNLSLLFQLADGSGAPDVSPEPIRWSYLDGDRWLLLAERRLLEDTTSGLLNTGILAFDLPPVSPSTLLPPELYWIRASIARNSRGVCDVVAVHSQAVRATRAPGADPLATLGPPLPPDTISEAVDRLAEVKQIRQPYSSFGGRDAEQPSSFYTRVSERLRHKNRALTCWDYERLILEAFPQIYKVKCLPVGSSDDPREADVVQVIVVPDIRGKLPSDPFQPKAPADLLLAITQFLDQRAPPLARFRVKNPRYVQLHVRVAIRFQTGCNAGFYRSRLNDDLVRYLAPWAYDEGADIVLGGQIDDSRIANFLEERPYVDYIAQLGRWLTGPDGSVWNEPDATDIVVVSAREHDIMEFDEQRLGQQVLSGIGYLKISADFRVAANNVSTSSTPRSAP